MLATEDNSWSFEIHPPSHDENIHVWSEEIEELASRFHESPCRIYEEVAYAKYQERFPGFRPFADQPGMREGWLRASVENEMFTDCYFGNLQDEITGIHSRYLDLSRALAFCGNFSRAPSSAEEAQAIRSFLLLVQMANSGNLKAVGHLLDLENERWPSLRFDSAFRHYFLTVYELISGDPRRHFSGKSWTESASLLDPETRQRVEEAARQRKLTAVLSALPPCAPLPAAETYP